MAARVTSDPPAVAPRPFTDRAEAGRLLADQIVRTGLEVGVVVGLAHGGVAVAAEVARRLGVPLDALAVRKVGHPMQPEFAVGATTPTGGYVRTDPDLTPDEIERAVARARDDAVALDRRLHDRRPAVPVAGTVCVLVDDGVATGATMIAGVRWARAQGARSVVVAVPVAVPSTLERLQREADAVVYLQAPKVMFAVAEWYDDFRQISDEEVIAMLETAEPAPDRRTVQIEAASTVLTGDLTVPPAATGMVVFAHGSGSSRLSPRNQQVARELTGAGLATLLFDLLEPDEAADRARVFDIELLSQRLVSATAWLGTRSDLRELHVGYFGASTGAAAALRAATEADHIRAVVSRGGRPDLAWPQLAAVRAPET